MLGLFGKKDIKVVLRLIGLTEKITCFNQNKKSLIKAVITREYSLLSDFRLYYIFTIVRGERKT